MAELKEIMKKVQTALDKLKNVENDVVKEVYTEINDYFVQVSEAPKEEAKVEEEVAEDEEEETEETEETEKSEETEEAEETSEKTETKTETEESSEEEVTSEEAVEETETAIAEESVKTTEKELSAEVSSKLKEAAIELGAKQEIIDGYKTKVVELETELESFREKERIELKRKYDEKANQLIELYSKLNIQKEFAEIELNYSEEQVDKLILDLEAVKQNVAKPVVRQTVVTPSLELSAKQKKTELNAEERAKAIFGI